MRALTLQGSRFAIEDVPEPVPAAGQVLVRPAYNGICGSDLHMRKALHERERVLGGDRRHMPKLVLGHEFSAELVAIGPGTQTDLRAGDRIVALPFTPAPTAPDFGSIGLAADHGGALAELMLVDAARTFRLPDTVPDDLAALTEPLSVGRHAADLADRHAGPNLIIGCGPIGLAVLLALKDAGRGPIIATDLSPERRRMATTLGADLVFDPEVGDLFAEGSPLPFRPEAPSPLLPRDFSGRPAGLNIFECTGVTSVFERVLRDAPRHSYVIAAGVCSHDVVHRPVAAMLRELTVEYSFAYTPRDFARTLDMIERQPDLVAKLVTSRVPLAETEAAFDRLHGTPREIKVLIDVRA